MLNGVWMLDEKHLDVEKSACMGEWAINERLSRQTLYKDQSIYRWFIVVWMATRWLLSQN